MDLGRVNRSGQLVFGHVGQNDSHDKRSTCTEHSRLQWGHVDFHGVRSTSRGHVDLHGGCGARYFLGDFLSR
ncbi:hypothetical protein Hamer_G025046 [Homarus americanus]|uniref:Uncharacterized protein n=1 Tax=Homarus americanus TaxID=6706 RepID=A0A8J5TIU5_HOMAM|nr:hypothetical protein Hamer_G025046 [Homarus americanus]